MLSNILHNLLHKHPKIHRAGVGRLTFCIPLFGNGGYVAFQAEGSRELVPVTPEQIRAIVNCESYSEALAVLNQNTY